MQPTCTNCGSDKLIPDVWVLDTGRYAEGELMVEVATQPQAMFFQGAVRSRLRAQVCGSCGYTEFIAQEPERLYEAYLRSLES